MKLFVILSSLSVVVACFAAAIDNKVKVKSYYNEISEDSYSFGYVLNDQQSRAEMGNLVQVGDRKVWTVSGSYSFIGTDGITYNVIYNADESGFEPTVLKVNKPQQIFLDRNAFSEDLVSINPVLIKTILG